MKQPEHFNNITHWDFEGFMNEKGTQRKKTVELNQHFISFR